MALTDTLCYICFLIRGKFAVNPAGMKTGHIANILAFSPFQHIALYIDYILPAHKKQHNFFLFVSFYFTQTLPALSKKKVNFFTFSEHMVYNEPYINQDV